MYESMMKDEERVSRRVRKKKAKSPKPECIPDECSPSVETTYLYNMREEGSISSDELVRRKEGRGKVEVA